MREFEEYPEASYQSRRGKIFDSATHVDWTQMKAFRQRYGLLQPDLANAYTASRLESGHTSQPTPDTHAEIYFSLMRYPYDPFTKRVRTSLLERLTDREYGHNEAIREAIRKEEFEFSKSRWLATLAPLTLGDSIRQLIVAEGLTKTDFRNEMVNAVVTRPALSAIIKGKRTTTLFSLNHILDSSLLRFFGEDDPAVQLVRLKTIPQAPMSKQTLGTCTYGSFIKYALTAFGHKQEQVEQDLGLSVTKISYLERRTTADLQNPSQQKVHEFLGIREGDALYKVLDRKQVRPQVIISTTEFDEIKRGKLLFANPEDLVDPAVIPHEDIELLDRIRTQNYTVGDVTRSWRNQRDNMTQKAFAEYAGINASKFNLFENGKRPLQDRDTLKIFYACGYDIHHPITQHFLRVSSVT